jgi:hypothetical protein
MTMINILLIFGLLVNSSAFGEDVVDNLKFHKKLEMFGKFPTINEMTDRGLILRVDGQDVTEGKLYSWALYLTPTNEDEYKLIRKMANSDLMRERYVAVRSLAFFYKIKPKNLPNGVVFFDALESKDSPEFNRLLNFITSR